MQVLVTVIDDNGNPQTFQLERAPDTPNYAKFKAGNRPDPLIYAVYVSRDFKAAKES